MELSTGERNEWRIDLHTEASATLILLFDLFSTLTLDPAGMPFLVPGWLRCRIFIALKFISTGMALFSE